MPDIRSYRDTPKSGETDAQWCAYVVEDNGHITRQGTTGHPTEDHARAAVGDVDAQRRIFAREYVGLLNSQPNGLGQHVHPIWGPSHHMFGAGRNRFGEREWNAAVDAAFIESKGAEP
jgi:hypothetical protein